MNVVTFIDENNSDFSGEYINKSHIEQSKCGGVMVRKKGLCYC